MNIRPYAYSTIKSALVAGALALPGAVTAQTQTQTGQMTVRLAINGSCSAVSDGFLDFPAQPSGGSIAAEATGHFQVTCTIGTPFQVGLGAGSYFDAGTRRMADSTVTNFITYQLFKDNLRSQAWGDQDTDKLTGLTGTGNPMDVAVYGRVPSQSFSGPDGLYSDTVNITVTY